ncbi:MAG: hypothetical protein V3T72_06875 [Thermoanaerobaculia bacterium]
MRQRHLGPVFIILLLTCCFASTASEATSVEDKLTSEVEDARIEVFKAERRLTPLR